MHDISRSLHPQHPVWPGDSPFQLELTARIAEGSSVNIMQLRSSTHLGTHVDAPFHYDDQGVRLGEVALEHFIGEACVIHALNSPAVGAEAIAAYDSLPARVLFFTGQAAQWQDFPEGFCPLSPELIHALAAKGVRVVGTDSPSVDAFSSKDLPVHRACAETGLLIIEGLNLQGIAEGRYQLVCLPLSLPEADASPARAILL